MDDEKELVDKISKLEKKHEKAFKALANAMIKHAEEMKFETEIKEEIGKIENKVSIIDEEIVTIKKLLTNRSEEQKERMEYLLEVQKALEELNELLDTIIHEISIGSTHEK